MMTRGRRRLLQWLERSKLNQKEGARAIRLEKAQMNKIVHGIRRPGLDAAVKIERVTGIPPRDWAAFLKDESATRSADSASTR